MRIMTPQHIAAFAACLAAEERAPATIAQYTRALSAFVRYLCGREVTKQTTLVYKAHLITRYSPAGVNAALLTASSFAACADDDRESNDFRDDDEVEEMEDEETEAEETEAEETEAEETEPQETIPEETEPPHIHAFATEWTIDTSATCMSEGSQSRHCACGEKTDVKPVPKGRHNFTSGDTCSVCSAPVPYTQDDL